MPQKQVAIRKGIPAGIAVQRQTLWRVLLWGILVGFTLYVGLVRPPFTSFDWVNVLVHESGHLFLTPFAGASITVGGPLFNLLVPLLLVGAYLLQDDSFGASVGLWWLGQSATFLSTYIGEGRAHAIELVRTTPDWNVLHQLWGTTATADGISNAVWAAGMIVMTGALTLALVAIIWSRRSVVGATEHIQMGGFPKALLPPLISSQGK